VLRSLPTKLVRVIPQHTDGTPAPTGFGLVVGERFGTVYVATPYHVVFGPDRPSSLGATPGVVFRGDRFRTIQTRRLNAASERDDLAVIEVIPPQGLAIPRAPMAVAAQRGTWVWNIGIGQDWDMPDRAGGLGPLDVVTGLRRVGQLRTPRGASGGAVVTDSGVIGIVLQDATDYSLLLPVERIVQVFMAWDLPVNLLTPPPAASPAASLPVAPFPLTIPAGFSASDFRIVDRTNPPVCESGISAPPEPVPITSGGLANLALLKRARVSASSFLAGFPNRHQVDFLTDGWYNNCRSWVPTAMPAWVVIDLGDTYEVSSVTLGSEHTKFWGDRTPSEFSIAVRADRSSNWDFIYRHDANQVPVQETTDFPFSQPQRVQYVRIDITNTKAGDLPRLDEVEIYGRRDDRDGLQKGEAETGQCGGAATTVSLSTRSARALSVAEECAVKPKDVFTECDKCPEMVVARAGSFIMGSPDSEKERNKDEGPQHRVMFAKAFAVGQFAVTFDEWDACVADGGCGGYKPDDHGWGRGRRPVINVSWDDAKAYVAWLSGKTRKTYRLLSEAEREYVTRAGSTTPFWWGPKISHQQANYVERPGPGLNLIPLTNPPPTVPVDSFQPNPWSLYQVHGNVKDWTEDCYHSSYFGAPTDGSAWTTTNCSRRVLRGGGLLRSAARSWYSADRKKEDFGAVNDHVGFRVGRTLSP
jgi:formylglycine-generating enzyme required for sulfatase activity